MKMKKRLKIVNDSPFSFGFAFISILFFVVNIISKGKVGNVLLNSPTKSTGENAFLASSALSYLRIFFYVFGSKDFLSLSCNLIFVLLLGKNIERFYGSVLSLICFLVSTIFSSVLSAIFCSYSLSGCSCVVMMMIFQTIFMEISENKISLPSVLVVILFILHEIFSKNQNGALGLFVNLIGGICGSLLSFVISPLLHHSEKKGSPEKPEKPKNSQKNDKSENSNNDDDDDSTIVGTLKF